MVLAAVATVTASPFVLDYDLMILAVAMVFVTREGLRHGFEDYEKITLLAAFALPAVARPLALGLHVPIAPLVVAALFAVVARRVGRGMVTDGA